MSLPDEYVCEYKGELTKGKWRRQFGAPFKSLEECRPWVAEVKRINPEQNFEFRVVKCSREVVDVKL